MPDPSKPVFTKTLANVFNHIETSAPALGGLETTQEGQLTLKSVYDKLNDIERLLKHIFGNSVLIDGVFIDILKKEDL
jgi:hypothetical protein